MQMDSKKLEKLQNQLLKVEAQIEKYEDLEHKDAGDKNFHHDYMNEKRILKEEITALEGLSELCLTESRNFSIFNL